MLGQLKSWITGSREPGPLLRMPETVEFVRIETAHGTSVRILRSLRTLAHDCGQTDGDELSACRFARWPNLLFLFDGADQCRDLQIWGSEWRAPVLALRVGQTDQPGRYFLCHPLNGKHLSAEPPDKSGVGALPINRLEVGPWELFSLRATPPFLPTRRQQSVAVSLDALLTRTGQEGLQDVVKTGAGLGEACLAAVAMQLPIGVIDEFSRAILRDADLSRVFAAAFPNDIWASQALPSLVRHQGSATKEDRRILAIGTDLDPLAQAGFDGDYCSFGHLCNALARRNVLPTRRVCVLATCRNEGAYLLEWLAYHIGIGVDTFFLYSNDNQDGSDALLHSLAEAGVITWIKNTVAPGISPQYKAYGHAMQFLPELLAYEWALVIDIDEFFVFNRSMFSSISDYLEWQQTQPVDAISLSWLNYGPNKQALMSDEPVHRRFTERLATVDHHVKSVFKPRLFLHSHCHFPVWDHSVAWNFRCSDRRTHPKVREANGSAFSPHPRAEFAWINHYIMKSAEEFILRRSSPRGDGPASSTLPLDVFTATHMRWFRDFYDSADGIQDSRIRDCCPVFEAELKRLQSLLGVTHACGLIAAAMARRRAELLDLVRGSDRFSAAGTDEEWFGSLLLERQLVG